MFYLITPIVMGWADSSQAYIMEISAEQMGELLQGFENTNGEHVRPNYFADGFTTYDEAEAERIRSIEG